MIGKITPLVKEAKRTWYKAALGHLVGAALSASILGFVLGTLGLLVGLERWVPTMVCVGGVVFLVCALREAGILRLPLPSLQRQTPEWCQCVFGTAWGSFAWGFDLGQGWTTHAMFSGYYGLLLWTVLGVSPAQGALILGAYGLGRTGPVLWAGASTIRGRLDDPSDIHVSRLPIILQVNAVALALAAGYFLAGALPW